MAKKITLKTPENPGVVYLSAAAALRLERARGEYARVCAQHAQALEETQAAYGAMQKAFASALESGGAAPDGAVWEIVEEGDMIKLVRREDPGA